MEIFKCNYNTIAYYVVDGGVVRPVGTVDRGGSVDSR